MSSPVLPGEWSLKTSQESVFEPDDRTPVPEDEYKDGGAFRSIVKLRMWYNKDQMVGPYTGTGWLIASDVLVTAGHNVHSYNVHGGRILGRAVGIECYIGYHGRHSIEEGIQDHSVQQRKAKYIITTPQWLDSSNNRHHDVAFIKVDRPFTGNLQPFSYMPTPVTESGMRVGVVGYPSDRNNGSIMYQEFGNISNNLNDLNVPFPMLRYRISTNGGQSGSPVILSRDSEQVVIATHVYGCDKQDRTNKGSLIGPLWNDYNAYHSVLAKQGATDKEGIQFLDLPPPGGAAELAQDPDDFVDITSNSAKPSQTEESFGEITKVGLQIGKLALGFATKPSCLGKVLHDCSSNAGPSSDNPNTQTSKLVDQRATMSGTHRQVVIKLNPKELEHAKLLRSNDDTRKDGFTSMPAAPEEPLEKAVVQMRKRLSVMGITQSNAMQLNA